MRTVLSQERSRGYEIEIDAGIECTIAGVAHDAAARGDARAARAPHRTGRDLAEPIGEQSSYCGHDSPSTRGRPDAAAARDVSFSQVTGMFTAYRVAGRR